MDDNKDLPVRNDIRLLGRLLGDTVREQRGEAIDGKANCPSSTRLPAVCRSLYDAAAEYRRGAIEERS